jgi:branched-chain amino acid transport system permease protein
VTVTLLVTQVLTGVVGGLVYVLLALGLTLIFGLMRIVNFAHGAFYMLGAYTAVVLVGWTGNFWLALLVAPVVVGGVGAAVERGLIRPLYDRSEYDSLLLTFGLSFVIVELVKLRFGKLGQPFSPPPGLADSLVLGSFVFPKYLVFMGLAAVVAVVVLWLFLQRTDLGLAIRAGTQDNVMVRALGVDFDRTRIIVFALGIALAALAGVLNAPFSGVNPDMGLQILIFAFVTVVVGGLGSHWGAVAGGLLIGVVYSLTSLLFPQMAQVAVFSLMAVILLVRPAGLLGSATS